MTLTCPGHIAIDTAVFPPTTTGYQLDILARSHLWQDGLDYRHGTSHGVGSFLGVHEGPQGVGTRKEYDTVKLQAGMVISNEPGYYKDGAFGIRIENVVLCKPITTRSGLEYLRFERVTMVSHILPELHLGTTIPRTGKEVN